MEREYLPFSREHYQNVVLAIESEDSQLLDSLLQSGVHPALGPQVSVVGVRVQLCAWVD